MKPGALIGWFWVLSFFISVTTVTPQRSADIDATPIGVTRATKIVLGEGYVTELESMQAKLTVLEVLRGEEAWRLVRKASSANKSPETGFEYVIARILFEFGADEDEISQKSYGIRTEQFTSVSETGRQYDRPSIVQPQPELSGRIYPGDSIEGWIAFLVSVDDKKPLMCFGNNYYRVYFNLYQE